MKSNTQVLYFYFQYLQKMDELISHQFLLSSNMLSKNFKYKKQTEKFWKSTNIT